MYKDLSVLCVEDESGVRKHIVNTLKFYFKEVYEASNGEEGLDTYYEHRPDIILCDIEMPLMDGIELIKKIRKEDIITPIVLLTAHNSEEYLMQLINLHVQHFILKPISSQSLEEGLHNALHGKYTGLIRLGEHTFLDIDNLNLKFYNQETSLSLREVKFLTQLSSGNVVHYNTIEEELWGDKPMSMDALKSFIRDLRKKLPLEIIENVPQVGYKLI
ncbi:response regulator transcription factor [Sulfurospirillum arcachonense]|uniref:response regulator transcription factor n=1 Tax=Sulfurospirillum arcachonense TaxID=57666 RepID=UPI000467EDCB|nr:response regulator [Sulfurospirillum arcachonense]